MVHSVRPRAEQRSAALIVAGCVLAAIGCLAFFVVAYDAYRYASVALHLKRAHRMRIALFGGVAMVFGGSGFALGLVGLRKR